MPATIPADVNHDVVAWARDESGYTPETVARRLGVKTDRLLAWERGERKPTIRQAQELARFYRRPLGVFFLPQPPALPPLASAYRRLRGVTPGVESPEFRLALRTMAARRETTLELRAELDDAPVQFQVSARLADGAIAVGRRIRQALGLGLAEQFAWRNEWQAWRGWRSLVESAGILVFQYPNVALAEARGVSLVEFPLPAVGINTREQAPAARIFALVHEVAHVALALGQEERVALRETRTDEEWGEVERFAEEAASEAIVPGDALEMELRKRTAGRDRWDVTQVRTLAARFRVTPMAMATRLRAAGKLSWDGYRRWAAEWNELVSQLKPRRAGVATPVDKIISRAGRPFARLVLDALDSNRITAVDACQHLDLRFDHLEALRAELRAAAPARGADEAGE